MNLIKSILRRCQPNPAVKKSGTESPSADIYRNISVSESGIGQGEYKKYLGGGEDQWNLRGAFQLFFLKEMGLSQDCHFLDIGCGPIRAGVYLIDYLNESHYYGIDYNQDFIQAAHQIVEDKNLLPKKPKLKVVDNFSFQELEAKFDYAIAFSVLNHCYQTQRYRFFEQLSYVMKKGAKVYITHAFWFNEKYLKNEQIQLTNQWHKPTDWHEDLNMADWGFPEKTPFPIIELTIR